MLVISLFLNLLLIGGGSIVVHKIGGIDFIKKQMQPTPSGKGTSDYYYTKKSIFEKSDVKDVHKIFIGDSITDYGEFQEYFPDEVVLNRGIRNDVSKGVVNRIKEVVGRNSKEAYLMIGVNDIRYSTDRKNFQKHITAIVKSFESENSKLFIQSILPVNNKLFGNEVSNEKVNQFNEVLQRIAEENGIEYIDLHSSFVDQNGQLDEKYTIDGLHLNGEGYKVWMDVLRRK
ncbi:MAG TPA: GDSL-type esterase/lipase family protein [Sporosarcina psychrophila]|uniref:GDSL-type esterase/lipase family protein n=1 Tax=Sporosarcina psychrophila TaxID=1476 RepID=A0A921KF54_SPOPS|nr:GDSL-type esterase/lipase family protein [Sporosarcina psychrophila]